MTGSEYRAARGLPRPWPGVPRHSRKVARRLLGMPRRLLRVPRRLLGVPPRWLRLPRRTVRLRLTLVYGCLFLLSGAALLAITYLLVSRSLPTGPVTGRAAAPPLLTPGGVSGGTPGGVSSGKVFVQAKAGSCGLFTGPLGTPAQVAARAQRCLSQQRALELKQLLTESGIALAIMTVVSIGLGWLVAGRVLRKLRTITAAARSISASSLHARLTLAGPDDELKELGDTFDGLLARLEAAFGAQRQFVANASHELRTPLARQRTLIEVALADPEPSVGALQDVCARVLATGEQQERLIEALLTLARSQRGLDRREPMDLAVIAAEVLEARRPEAERRGLTVDADLQPAPALGDARLSERLAANLVDNAMRHNVAHGTIQVATEVVAGHAVLAVRNTGPVVPPDQVPRLFQPFQRSGAGRTGTREGQGLGLSIVAAIAEAHGAWLQASALTGGGLRVQAGFPQRVSPPPTAVTRSPTVVPPHAAHQ
jgi:signal transduction histidine kinase